MKKFAIKTLILLFALQIMLPAGYACAKAFDFSAYPDMGVAIVETNSGDTVLANNPQTRYYPGSITKLLTLITALDSLSLTEEITVGADMLALVMPDSSLAYLAEGETLSFEQLVYAMMLPSGNDASKVVAVYAGRKLLSDPAASAKTAYDAFIAQMNAKAQALGMKDSSFTNSDGYDDPDNYSTPNDLILLGKEALRHAVIAESAGTYYYYAKTNKAEHHWYSTDLFLYPSFDNLTGFRSARRGINPYFDERVNGLKTGTTDIGGKTFLLSADDESMSLIGVFMNVPMADADEIWDRASVINDFVYENFTRKALIDETNRTAEYKVSNHGFLKSPTLTLAAASDLCAVLDKETADSVSIQFTPAASAAQLKENGKLKLLADIKAGDEVMLATFQSSDGMVKTMAFVAVSDYRKLGAVDIALYIASAAVCLLLLCRLIYVLTHAKKLRKTGNGRKTV